MVAFPREASEEQVIVSRVGCSGAILEVNPGVDYAGVFLWQVTGGRKDEESVWTDISGST